MRRVRETLSIPVEIGGAKLGDKSQLLLAKLVVTLAKIRACLVEEYVMGRGSVLIYSLNQKKKLKLGGESTSTIVVICHNVDLKV